MDCTQTAWLNNEEYLRQFNDKTTRLRIPLSGSIELTRRCNLKCAHCYVGSQSVENKLNLQEMSTGKILSVIDEITEAECLDLLITGGEPLLHKDFIDIYRHIKLNGLIVTVFTNGTLTDADILDLFAEFPPQTIEISLYGATAATYEQVTGVKGSYEKCINGIRKLLDHKINVELKTILMTINRHEFFDMENMAKDLGVGFRFDPAIFPCFDGDKTPLTLRVSPEEAIEKEFSNYERRKDWKDFLKRFQQISMSDTLYYCAAGVTSFHIDPYGNLQPCLMTNNPAYSLNEGSFLTGWQKVIPLILERKTPSDHPCRKCESNMLCGYCPAFFGLENNSEDVPSEYLCSLGRFRYNMIQNTQ